MSIVALNRIAFARPGDKGNDSDVTVFARSDAAYAFLVGTLTADVVKRQYGAIVAGEVTRWEVPKVWALHFLLRDALAGGGPSSLRADNLGKALAGTILRLELDVPEAVLVGHPAVRVPADPYVDADWTVRT